MRNRRRFSLEFKRQVVEELMRGESGPAQLCRKYDVCASLLYHWKDMYCGGRFNNAPTQEGAVRDRVDKLERLVGGERGFKKGISDQSQPVFEKRQIVRVGGCLGVTIGWGCTMMQLARSSFYHKPKEKTEEEQQEADIRDNIEAMCIDFPRYGYRRVTAALVREGKRVNHKKELRLMRDSDLLCRVKRVVTRLAYFLERVYNHKRRHSALGYLPPHEFEKLLADQENDGLSRQILLTLPVQAYGCSPPVQEVD